MADEEAGILTTLTDLIIARHKLSLEKGALIQNTHHLRDNTKKIEELFTMQKLAQQYPPDLVAQAIDYCLTYQLYSAVDCRSAAEYLLTRIDQPVEAAPGQVNFLPDHLRIKAARRDIAVYAGLTGGEKG